MVKIRYAELPAGLHVTAEDDRLDTVVYLQPGLTAAQRRAALTRVRSSARIGQGPALPPLGMVRALAADRVRTTTRIGAAATRRHPMLVLTPLLAVVASAVAFVLISYAPMPAGPHGKIQANIPSLKVNAGRTSSPPSQKDRDSSAGRTARSRHIHARQIRRSKRLSTSSTAGQAPPTSRVLPRPPPVPSPPCVTLDAVGLCTGTLTP